MRRRLFVRGALVGLLRPGLAISEDARLEPRALAASLRRLYQASPSPGERWRGTRPFVTLGDGRRVARDEAYRDEPAFVAAAGELLGSPLGDDAPLGAWLLATLSGARQQQAEPRLLAALLRDDRRVVFEAIRGLGRVGSGSVRGALLALARSPDPILAAAALVALDRLAGRLGPASPRPVAANAFPGRGFQRGVAWWRREAGRDLGEDTFPELRALGVDSVAIHTWDPLQRALDDPKLASPWRPPEIPDLPELVRGAHAAGLRVMLKPHFEMAGRSRPQEEWHNNIEMRSEADWQLWFSGYEQYLLGYARAGQAAGADLLCVGRELDRTVVLREKDWRALIAKVRGVYRGPLVYSANFDSYQRIGFWDALDFIGISAYFPLSEEAVPTREQLLAGWRRALVPLLALARRTGRPVLLTEVGYPATASAARTPWTGERGSADTLLQARCYDALFSAIASETYIHGVYAWLWEGTRQPPFRDSSFSVQAKPAADVIGRAYRGLLPLRAGSGLGSLP